LETYKCELRQAYEKKGFVYTIFNNSEQAIVTPKTSKGAEGMTWRGIQLI